MKRDSEHQEMMMSSTHIHFNSKTTELSATQVFMEKILLMENNCLK